jgi:uncharacterized membrane protein YuzA (DUF378 family)
VQLAPQWAVFDETHAPLHATSPPAHPHTPAWQAVPVLHETPQAPQFSLSLMTSTQVPLHSSCADVQVERVLPPFVQSAARMVRKSTVTDRSKTFIPIAIPGASAADHHIRLRMSGGSRQDAAHPSESTSRSAGAVPSPAPPASSAPAPAASGARGSLRSSWLWFHTGPGGATFKGERNAMDNAHTGGLTKALLVIATIGAINWGLIGFFNWNLVDAIFGGNLHVERSAISRVIYALVGIAGVAGLIGMFRPVTHHVPGRREHVTT